MNTGVGGMPFAWQTGYTAFSVSQSKVEQVRSYIANQETHHRRLTYQEEVKALLKKHGMGYEGMQSKSEAARTMCRSPERASLNPELREIPTAGRRGPPCAAR
jgi:hypothetical protein